MTAPEQFAIVPVEGKSPPEAIVVGPMSEVTSYIGQSIARIEEEQRLAQSRADAAEVAQQQDEIRSHAAQMLADGMERLSERLDAFEANQKARADQLRRDEEEAEIARVEAMIGTLPDPDLPNAEMALRHSSSKDSSHAPSGDLHVIAPVDKEPFDHDNPDPDDPENVDDADAPPGEYAPTPPLPSPIP
jgi:hypothetical protein